MGFGHIPNNSCQPLDLEEDIEFININFSFYRRRSGSLAQSKGTKALPKVRFVSLLSHHIFSENTQGNKALKGLSSSLLHLSEAMSQCSGCSAWAASMWVSGHGALFIPEQCLVGQCGGV